MKNNKTKPHNRNSQSPQRLAARTPILALLLAGFSVWLFIFLRQPSLFGFVDEQGTTFDRFVDLLVMPSLLPGMWGDGLQAIGVFDRLPLLVGLLGWLGLATWIGLPLVSYGLPVLSRLERLASAALAGLALLSTVTLLVGLAGGLGSRWPLVAVMLALAAISTIAVRHASFPRRQEQGSPLQDLAPRSTLAVWCMRLTGLLTCFLAGWYVLGSFLPAWEFDVVEYHLQAPREFHERGRVGFVPHNVYANMPLGAEMHSLAAMTLVGGNAGWWWGGLLGKSITGSYSLLAGLLIGGFVARHLGRVSGWGAAGLFLATPGNMHVASAGLIDMAVGAYVLAGFVAATALWQTTPTSRTVGFLGVLQAALFAGAAAACKYPGLIFAVVPVVIGVPWLVARWRLRHAALWSMPAIALGLSLTCLPWYAKNAYFTGNPVYPLAYSLFGGTGLDDARAEQWNRAHRLTGDIYTLQALGDSIFQVTFGSPFVNPSLMFLAACGLLATLWSLRKQSDKAFKQPWILVCLSLMVWIFSVWWTATHRIDRFWLPILPLVACVSGVGMWRIGTRVGAGLAMGIVLVGIAYGNLVCMSGAGLCDNRFFISLSSMKDGASEPEHSGLISPVTAWINGQLPASKLLLVGEAKAFHFERPVVYATCFNENPAESWLMGVSSETQRANLIGNGITHMLVDWGEIERYRSPGNYGFSDWPQRNDTDQLLRDGVVERVDHPFESERVEIFRVLPERN